MDFGVGYFPTHDGMAPGAVARMVEERGPESLFFAEHTHIPASRESPWSGGGELPSGGRSAVERALERWENAIAEFNGE